MTQRTDVRCTDLDSLLAEYADAAMAHRRASREGNDKVANPAYKRLSSIVQALWMRGAEGREALLRLLDDPRIEVRGWAAAHALEIAPERAVAVLDELASGPPSLEEFSAKMVLQQWHAGTFRARGK